MSDEYFRDIRQRNVIQLDGQAQLTGRYVIVSQSCDVVLPKRHYIQLAPVVSLSEPGEQRGALQKENPRYPHLGRNSSDHAFADLAQIVSVLKSEVALAPLDHSLAPENAFDEREFGLAVGRWFGRFAIPDLIQPWLAPLQTLIREKHDSPNSAIGKVLQDITEIRVEAVDWAALPAILTVHVIVKAGTVPTLPDDIDFSAAGPIPEDLTALCTAITTAENSIRRATLWSALAGTLAARCRPKGRYANDPEIKVAVSDIQGELSSDDEFPLSRMRRSEQLDVDFLSEPAPF